MLTMSIAHTKYNNILVEIASKTSTAQTFALLRSGSSENKNSTITNWNSARELMCKLCDSDGIIKQEVADSITADILPGTMGETPDSEMALDCLAKIFTILDNIFLFDSSFDRKEPNFFDRNDPSVCKRMYDDSVFLEKLQSEYFPEAILETESQKLSRSVVVDLVHDAFLLLNKVVSNISKNELWDTDFPDKTPQRRLDKFIGDHGSKIVRQDTVPIPIYQGKSTRVHLFQAPETFEEFWEKVSAKLQRFLYLFQQPKS
jgi:hypothetical protein